MNYTPQQQAIRNWLSKPAPYGIACGCLGPKQLDDVPGFYPECPCFMQYIEEVDGVFYKIVEHRSPDGVSYDAVEIGPRGGPYRKIT